MYDESGGAPLEPESPATSTDNTSRTLETFHERLVYFAARRLRDRAEAQDVAQETLRRAVEALQNGSVQNPSSLPAFLYQTALHICQHRTRSAGRENRALSRFSSDTPAKEQVDALHLLIAEERRSEVRVAFNQLKADDQEILRLSYLDVMPAAEIGRRLGLSEGNVRVRRHRALQRLGAFLVVTPDSKRGLKR